MAILKKAKNTLRRLSGKVGDFIGLRKSLKELDSTPEALKNVIEKEGLEADEDVKELIEKNGGILRSRKRKRIKTRALGESNDDDQEIKVYKELFRRIKTGEGSFDSSRKNLLKVKFESVEAALESRLADVTVDYTFGDNLVITSSKEIDLAPENFENDAIRETAFKTLALEALKKGSKLCKKNNIPFKRPEDYYAECIKSDEHMSKIRAALIKDVTRIETSEKARKQRTMAKFGKRLQAQKLAERQKKKAQTLRIINEAKKRGTIESVLKSGDDSENELHLKKHSKDKNRKSLRHKKKARPTKSGKGKRRSKRH